jgi:epoxyqueuosine reductase
LSALHSRAEYPSEMVREHIIWAIEQHEQRKSLIE